MRAVLIIYYCDLGGRWAEAYIRPLIDPCFN
jgi:hypothetical protein